MAFAHVLVVRRAIGVCDTSSVCVFGSNEPRFSLSVDVVEVFEARAKEVKMRKTEESTRMSLAGKKYMDGTETRT